MLVLPAAEHARRPRSLQVISPLAQSHRDINKFCCANREYQRTVPLLGVTARFKLPARVRRVARASRLRPSDGQNTTQVTSPHTSAPTTATAAYVMTRYLSQKHTRAGK